MLPVHAQEPETSFSSLRKLEPKVKLPPSAVLHSLGGGDVRTLKRRLSTPVECVFDPCFLADDAEKRIMAPLCDEVGSERRPRRGNDDSGVDWLSDAIQGLSPAHERRAFLRLNYCRYRVMQILSEHQGRRLTAQATRVLLAWENATVRTRNEIVRANVPLVLAMAKRTRITGVDFSDLISEGNLALLRSVDKFDCSRGFKFSTYACRAILKSFSRVATRTARYRGYFPTEFDPELEKSDYLEARRRGLEDDCVDELKSILGKNVARLNDVEQRVIRARFALDEAGDSSPASKAKTLEQVGELIGVTKERVRQIQNKALNKLRYVLEDGILAS